MLRSLQVIILIVFATCVTASANVASSHYRNAVLASHGSPLRLTADVQGDLEETLFVKVLSAVLPKIVAYARDITIPGKATEHFSFASFKFSSFNIGGISITFAAPNIVRMSINGLTFAVPQTHFDVYTMILFIKATCAGEFWVSLAPSTITVDLHIATDAQGKLVFTSGTSSVTFGALNIDHKFSAFLCKVGEDIIQLFVGNIDTLLRNLVEKDLPALIAPLAEKALDGVFAKLPLVVVGNPVVNAQGITLTIDLIASMAAQQARNSVRRPPLPLHHRVGDLARDLVLTIPSAAIDNVLIYEDGKNHLAANISVPPNDFNTTSLAQLIPEVAKICAGCPVDIDIDVLVPPTVAFANDSATVNVNSLHIRLAAVNTAKVQLPLFSLNANLSLTVLNLTVRGASGNVIWFQLSVNDFSFAIDKSEVGPININWLSPIVEYLLKLILIPAFNQHFAGITLPTIVENVVLDVNPGTLILGINLNIA